MPMSSPDNIALGPLVLTDEHIHPARDAALDALVERAGGGDARAFGDLVGRYEDRVLSIAWRLLRNRDDAMDAAQETFVRMYKYLRTFDRNGDLGAWIYQIAVNVCRRMGARRSRAAGLVRESHTDEPYTEASVGTRDLDRAMATLTEKERTALVLRDFQGMTTDEVARTLGSSPTTVRVHICMARKKMRRFLLDDRGGGEA